MKQSHYEILGIRPSAPPEAIERAYRALIARAARASVAEAEALRRDARLAREAFAELMDPDRRAAYDARIGTRVRGHGSAPGDGLWAPATPGPSEGDWRGPTLWAALVALLALTGLGRYVLADNQRALRAPEAAVHQVPVRIHSNTGVFSKRLDIVLPASYTKSGASGG